ncbi:MAG: sensor histidine kinase [Planctomycetota bacterium]|jgi:signal transduction histidine kinase
MRILAKSFGRTVRTRLAVWVVLLTILLLSGLVPIILKGEQDAVLERYKSQAFKDALAVLEVLEGEMMAGDTEGLRPRMQELTGPEAPERMRIFDRKGTVMVSTNKEEEGIQFSIDDPTCQVCHDRTPELRSKTIRSVVGNREVFRAVYPIRNKPSCSDAGETGCHPADQTYNGLFIADYSMEGFHQERRWHLARLALYVLGGAAVVGVAGTLTVSRVVLRPLKKVVRALTALGKGDFSVRVPEEGGEEIKALAQTLNQMSGRLEHLLAERRQAERAGKLVALGEVTAEFAHDIGSSLDGAMECLRMLRAGELETAQMEKYARLALEALERVEFMAKKLMLLGSHRAMKPSEVDVNAAVGRALEFIGYRLSRRGIGVEKNLAENLPRITTDGEGLAQILINILLNSLDAMGEKGGRMILATGRTEDGGLFIRVEDSGPGVPKPLRERIFDPFFSTKAEGRGAGLGLYIARKVMAEVGGSVALEKGSEGGAAFVIRLTDLSRRVRAARSVVPQGPGAQPRAEIPPKEPTSP